jgi:hypothetical protein
MDKQHTESGEWQIRFPYKDFINKSQMGKAGQNEQHRKGYSRKKAQTTQK